MDLWIFMDIDGGYLWIFMGVKLFDIYEIV